MAGIAGEAAKGIAGEAVRPLVQRLVDPLINEAHYFCCFSSYVKNFERQKNILAAKQEDVKIEIGKASGVSRVKKETMQWADEADNLIKVDTKTKDKWCLGVCPNCIWQYRKGKELAEKTLEIQDLLGRCSSKIVAGPADVPDMKYHSLSHFIHFGSREMKFQELMKALEDEECNLIGLHGMGGLGKTSLATKVGDKLEGSKFDKVILLVVSKPPDYKKIQGQLARRLDLTLKEGTEEEHSKAIWSKITNMKEKLLIILDDVWEAFDPKKVLGIPFGDQHKGCSVLITTRNVHVCAIMGCQKKIHLETLTDKEALDLFLAYAGIHNSSSFTGIAQNIVKHCGGVLVAIVAVARTLKDRPLGVWKEALKNLQNTKSLLNVNEDLTDVYKCLKLSYDNLKNETIRELFLICSLFPEDFKIPIEALGRIGIGVGLWGDVENYYTVRSKVREAVQELMDSCLLFNARAEHVKMHDLVREVALWIASKDIQSITDCKMPIQGDLRYLFWMIDEFPNKFDGMKVEILIIYLDGSNELNVPDTFFAKMTRLKVLFLYSDYGNQFFSSPSFLYSLQSLKDIRTLTLGNLILGDISTLGDLRSLESLELWYCSITELPREFMKLMKLRVLHIEHCEIEMNNPFEVIEGSSHLEELTFIKNSCEKERKDAVSPNLSPLTLHRYQISFKNLSDEEYGSISRNFQPGHLRHLISEGTFKQLVATSELLILGGWYDETGWKNIIPDIVPIDDKGMNDLNILHLHSWPEIQCLINAMNLHSDVIAFNNLVELDLYGMDVEVLYQGPLPSSFLVRLEIMKLRNCQKLSNILIKGKLSLRHLKAVELQNCPLLTSIFEPSTAETLEQLEELTIISCNALECIITNKSSGNETAGDDGDNDQKSNGSLFPKLKVLRIEGCEKLEIILPPCFIGKFLPLEVINVRKCENLKYIFDKFQEDDHVMLPSLKEMKLSEVPNLISIYKEPISSSSQRPSSLVSGNKSKEKLPCLDTSDFSGAQLCCFLHKSRTTIEETNVAASAEGPLDHTFPLGLHVSKKWFETTNIIIRQLLSFRHVKKMNFTNLSLKSASLFTLSIASNILWEELTIRECVGLKSIIASDADDYNDQMDNTSIFPKLQKLEIGNCKDLEFLVLSTTSVGIKNLKFLTIEDAHKLNYVVVKYHHEDHSSNQSQSDALQFHLPALEILWLQDVPKLIIKYFIDLMVCSDEGQQNQSITKPILLECLIIKRCHQLKYIGVEEEVVQVATNYSSIFSKLKYLEIEDCRELEFLFPSSLSIELKNLDSLTIKKAPELKYVIGKCQHEDHLSNQNQNDELHFHLPALEYLCFEDLPKMISICAMSYFLEWPSIQRVDIKDCSIKSFTHLMASSNEQHLNWKTTKGIHGVPPFQAAQSLMTQSLSNIREMELFNCSNLISLFTLQAASAIGLKYLTIKKCDQLKCIVADEGDTQVPMNHSSIFPKLEDLTIRHCKELEFLFPSSLSLQLKNLKSLTIEDAPELKFLIGKYQREDLLSTQNQNHELHFDLPVLEFLCFQNVPKMIKICVMNYFLAWPSLEQVFLRNCGTKSFIDLIVRSNEEQLNQKIREEIEMHMQTLTYLKVSDTETEEILNLTYLDVETNGERLAPLTSSLQALKLKDLTELRNICVGPKYILSLNNLKDLKITTCAKLKVVFSASVLRSLPKLKSLWISNCGELVHIIEEDKEENVGNNLRYEPCFPNLSKLVISCCDSLKYLFSITMSGILPKLSNLSIKDSSNLEHALIRQEETKVKDVLPELSNLKLDNLPNLISVSHGIDFLKLEKSSEVHDCPRFSFHETTTTYIQDGPKNLDSEFEVKTEEKLSLHLNTDQSDMGEAKGIKGIETQQSTANVTLNSTRNNKEARHSSLLEIADSHNASPKDELVVKEVKNDKTIMDLQQPTNGTPKSTNGTQEARIEIVEEDLLPRMPKMETSSFDTKLPEHLVSTNKEVGYSDAIEGPHSEKIEPRKAMPLTPFNTMSQDETSKIAEVRAKEGASLESIHPSSLTYEKSPNVTAAKDSASTTTNFFEEEEQEEEEGGLRTTRSHRSGLKTASSLLKKEHETSIHDEPSETILPLSPTPSEAPTSLKQTPSSTPSESTYGKHIQANVGITNQPSHEDVNTDQVSSQLVEQDMLETSNALSIPGVQEIVDMMKLEGDEPSMLTKALKNHPKLCLSTKDRSTELLCFSYRVLLNILNILANKTPFTITKADKKSLEKYLKDASVLGFDKNWLESIETKVFNCDVSEVHRMQEVLKDLGNKLKTHKAKVATVRDQEAKATRLVEMTQKELDAAQSHFNILQQEHANVRERHSQLLEEYQEILEQQNQYWETIAANFRHFDF